MKFDPDKAGQPAPLPERDTITYPGGHGLVHINHFVDQMVAKRGPVIPDIPPIVEALTKVAEGGGKPEFLTGNEQARVEFIFANAGLPPPDGITRNEWEAVYAPVFDATANKPNWRLLPSYRDERREAIQEKVRLQRTYVAALSAPATRDKSGVVAQHVAAGGYLLIDEAAQRLGQLGFTLAKKSAEEAFMYLEYAADWLAHEDWPDTAQSVDVARLQRQNSHPEQNALSDSDCLELARRQTKHEFQQGMDSLDAKGLLKLYAVTATGYARTSSRAGAYILANEVRRQMQEGLHLPIGPVPAQPVPAPPPMSEDFAPDAGEPAQRSAANSPPDRGLDTSAIAEAFSCIDGLRRKLSDANNHKWLIPARITQGVPPKPSTWCPLKLAKILLDRGASAEGLSRAFLKEVALKPWLTEWQEAKRERNAFGL